MSGGLPSIMWAWSVRDLLTESCDVVVDARLNRAQRVSGDATRELALGAGGKTAGYVANPLNDVGDVLGREICLLHHELKQMCALCVTPQSPSYPAASAT